MAMALNFSAQTGTLDRLYLRELGKKSKEDNCPFGSIYGSYCTSVLQQQ